MPAVWLLCIALELITTGHFFDIAVRDIELAIAAFVLAQLTEITATQTRSAAAR